MKTIIEYYRKFAYGRDDTFPTGEHADAIKILTGRKTLNTEQLEAIASLGMETKEVLPPTR